MIALLRTRVLDVFRRTLRARKPNLIDHIRCEPVSEFFDDGFYKSLHLAKPDIDVQRSVHIEPRLDPKSVSGNRIRNPHSILNTQPNSHSDAMANRRERRAPVLHAGESAQGRLF